MGGERPRRPLFGKALRARLDTALQLDAWRDPTLAAVMGARGGYSSAQMLPFLDPDIIREAAKPFIYTGCSGAHPPPNGTRLVYEANRQLYVRMLDQRGGRAHSILVPVASQATLRRSWRGSAKATAARNSSF